MPKYHIKAKFFGCDWGKAYGFVYADNKEDALKAATEGDVEWEHWKVYNSEVQDMSEFKVLGDEPDDD